MHNITGKGNEENPINITEPGYFKEDGDWPEEERETKIELEELCSGKSEGVMGLKKVEGKIGGNGRGGSRTGDATKV